MPHPCNSLQTCVCVLYCLYTYICILIRVTVTISVDICGSIWSTPNCLMPKSIVFWGKTVKLRISVYTFTVTCNQETDGIKVSLPSSFPDVQLLTQNWYKVVKETIFIWTWINILHDDNMISLACPDWQWLIPGKPCSMARDSTMSDGKIFNHDGSVSPIHT